MVGVLAAGAAADAPEPGGSGSGSGQRESEEEATGGPAAGLELTAHGSDAAERHTTLQGWCCSRVRMKLAMHLTTTKVRTLHLAS